MANEIEELKQLVIAGFKALGLEYECSACATNPSLPSIHKFTKKPKATRSRKPTEYSYEFEVAWACYPEKNGNKKSAAYAEWEKRCGISENETFAHAYTAMELMIDGTKRYAAYHKAMNTPEQYIHQGSTFYGREKLYNQPWDIPKQVIKLPADDKLEDFAVSRGLRKAGPGELYPAYRKYIETALGIK